MKWVFQIAIAIVAVSLAGCATTPKGAYRSSAMLWASPVPGDYHIGFTIEDVSQPGNPRVISQPKMIAVRGREGRIAIGDDRNGIICTALVNDSTGKPEAKTTVIVKRNGKIVLTEQHTIGISE